jgi:hypothetical protein
MLVWRYLVNNRNKIIITGNENENKKGIDTNSNNKEQW